METNDVKQKRERRSFELGLLYALIGIVSGGSLALLFYGSLNLNSSIATLIESTAKAPLYLFSYGILTMATIIAFGIHMSLLIYRWRTIGRPKIKGGISSIIGGGIGIFASACPACGSILLSTIGISSGLLAFPFAGLELKVLSFALIAIPLIVLARRIRREKDECKTGACESPKEDAFTDSDKKWIALLGIASITLLVLWINIGHKEWIRAHIATNPQAAEIDPNPPAHILFTQMTNHVVPADGWQSAIILHDAIPALAQKGVIDSNKVAALYGEKGVPEQFQKIITTPDDAPIHLTAENAPYYLNALWALGLANHMEINRASPVVGPDLFNFASTGGWTLGTESNGGTYFNAFSIVPLTEEQEALVRRVAENTYRPCCDNSSFFQDCNHGSALLGLLELGAQQGLDEDALYREALHFNAFWFPQQYIETAMYFKSAYNIDWANVDPRLVMSTFYSSASGWYKNVLLPLNKKGLIPEEQIGGTGC